MVPGQGGRGAAARHIKVPRLGAALCPLFASAFCVVFLASCVAFAVDRSASPRVMVTKAVCVLKGDGLVQGTIHFEQKARTGGGRPAARPCPHTCARERPAGPRAALATPLARGSAGRRTPGPRPCGARPRSAESPGEPAAVVRGEAWAGVQGGNTRRPCGCRPPRVSEGGEEAWEESRLPRRLLGVRRPGRRPEVLEDAVALLAGSVFGS